MKRQFVLDKCSNKILEDLAQYRGGNLSQVVREALRVYADMEERLERIEDDPAFQKMMAEADADIRAGRVTPHSEVMRMARARVRKNRKK
jgi:predicted transcriptional regulator